MSFKQEYENLKMQKLRGKFPTMPNEELMRTLGMTCKLKPPKSAAQYEALITSYVHMKGGIVTKVSVMGRQTVKTTKVTDVLGHANSITDTTYIPSTTKKGTSDTIISAAKPYAYYVMYVEIKFSKSDRQSEHQKEFELNVSSKGGFYRIVRTLDEFEELWYKWNEWIKERELIFDNYKNNKL
jgi:hypothetical protein